MKATPMAVVLLTLGFAVGILPFSAASAADSKPDVVFRWEYRVLTEEQVIALGKKDLAAGLNKLGDEGWELVTVGAHYIFKRPNGPGPETSGGDQAPDRRRRRRGLEGPRDLVGTHAQEGLLDGEARRDRAGAAEEGGDCPRHGAKGTQESAIRSERT